MYYIVVYILFTASEFTHRDTNKPLLLFQMQK